VQHYGSDVLDSALLRMPAVGFVSPTDLRWLSTCHVAPVQASASSGMVEGSQLALEKMLTYAHHLGLHTEEIGWTGEQPGTFPQVFTRLPVVDGALALDHSLNSEAHRRDEAVSADLGRAGG
jgi:GH15 family glucan-1,4-alpha-glucosidase